MNKSMHQEQVVVLLQGPPQKIKIYNCHPNASCLAVHPESVSLYKLKSAVPEGLLIVILTPLAHKIPSPSPQVDLRVLPSAWP